MKAVLAIAAACALALAGCAGDREPPPKPARQVGLRWEQFPDIPVPPGWKPLPGEDHVATAIGNGAARRMDVALVAPSGRSDLQPSDAMARYVAAALGLGGWSRDGEGRPDDLEQRWRKGGETLSVRGERDGGLAVLRYSLSGTP